MSSVVDLPALIISLLAALGVTLALWRARPVENHRRGWIVAGVVAAVLIALGIVDLLVRPMRDTHLVAPVVGGILPTLGALGMIRATRQVRPWIRWPLVFLTAYVLLFAGLLIGATAASKLL